MKYVTQGAVIKNHDFAQVGLNLGEVLDVSPIAEGAVLPIVSSHKVLALHFQPIDDRVGILLHGGSEDDKIIPLTNLGLWSAEEVRCRQVRIPFSKIRHNTAACEHSTK